MLSGFLHSISEIGWRLIGGVKFDHPSIIGSENLVDTKDLLTLITTLRRLPVSSPSATAAATN